MRKTEDKSQPIVLLLLACVLIFAMYFLELFNGIFKTLLSKTSADGFDLPVVKEVGASSTTEKVIETLSRSYLPYLFRTILAVMLIALFQNFFESAFPAKYIKYIPFGGIVVFLTCGTTELFISADLALIWAYWIFYLFYGMVYVLSEKRLILTLLLALIVIIF